jgi:hypothetical protein
MGNKVILAKRMCELGQKQTQSQKIRNFGFVKYMLRTFIRFNFL